MARPPRMERILVVFAGLALLWAAQGDASVPDPASAPVAPANGAPMLGWAAVLSSQLKLDPRQAAALARYAATVPTGAAQGPMTSLEQYRAMTQEERLTFLADRTSYELATLRAELEAFRAFYALLSPEQRALYETLARPTASVGEVADAPPDEKAPARPDERLAVRTEASWLVKPNGEDLWRVYPADAERRGVGGQVLLHCVVDVGGFVAQCTVASETPADQGFGNAALELTAYMRMTPATVHGVPMPSAVNIPVGFTPNPAAIFPMLSDHSAVRR